MQRTEDDAPAAPAAETKAPEAPAQAPSTQTEAPKATKAPKAAKPKKAPKAAAKSKAKAPKKQAPKADKVKKAQGKKPKPKGKLLKLKPAAKRATGWKASAKPRKGKVERHPGAQICISLTPRLYEPFEKLRGKLGKAEGVAKSRKTGKAEIARSDAFARGVEMLLKKHGIPFKAAQ